MRYLFMLESGKNFGRYAVLSLIGKGGMGEVYLAQDKSLNRKVALKILSAKFAGDDDLLRRFEREAETASALNHPNILTVYEFGKEDGLHFITTEFVEGETLREKLKRERLSVPEILNIAEQTASALAAAHSAGIIHRDVKPENIMLRADGLVKVLDFGLAKFVEKAEEHDPDAVTQPYVHTQPGTVMGTVFYMSPEQARGKQIDERSDVWSLGVILYEMTTSQLPFQDETASDVIASILKSNPAPITHHAKDAPRELSNIIMKALRKDSSERYQKMSEMLGEIKDFRQELEFEAKRLGKSGVVTQNNLQQNGYRTLSSMRSQQFATRIDATTNAPSIPAPPKKYGLPVLIFSAAACLATLFAWQTGKTDGVFNPALMVLIIALIAGAYLMYSAYFRFAGGADYRSIAVLPLGNSGGDAEMEYLSEGISESLINNLSQLPDVKVIARSSSFKYKYNAENLREIAKTLNVATILTGWVMRRGENLQISVELINARDNTQIWGEQYSRRADDLLVIQSDISREIADKLHPRLTLSEQKQLVRHETKNSVAYELLLKGRFYRAKGGTESRKRAVEYFNEAIAVDPNYALAYAELAFTYRILVGSGSLDPKEFTPKAEAAALKALELDETLADAHFALAFLKINAWEWAEAEFEFKRAIELNPNLARAYIGYSGYLSRTGRHDEAVAEIRRAKELDPLSTIINGNYGLVLYFAGRYDEAIKILRETLEFDPNFSFAHLYLGYNYSANGMFAEAIEAYRKAFSLGQETPSNKIYLGAAYARAGERDKAQAILSELETGESYVSPAELAVLYTALGDREKAFASLEKAFALHDLQLQYLATDPAFKSLRDDSRFTDLLKKIGLPLEK
ncbi:MAG TPA: protein kinase [Pyrinomonadaceae bacterium]|jgi:serine/threonine protein kinase/TolB-like protein/Flp pilus assembly protein TadD